MRYYIQVCHYKTHGLPVNIQVYSVVQLTMYYNIVSVVRTYSHRATYEFTRDLHNMILSCIYENNIIYV